MAGREYNSRQKFQGRWCLPVRGLSLASRKNVFRFMLRLQGQSNETNRTFQSLVECRSNAYDCPAGYTITARGHQMFMFSWGSIATPWSGVLLEKLTGSQLVKKFPTFYGTRRFITAFTSARHIALSLALGQTNTIKKLRIARLNRNVRY